MQVAFMTSRETGLIKCSVERRAFEDTHLTIEVEYTIKHEGKVIGKAPSLELAKAIAKDYIKTGQAF